MNTQISHILDYGIRVLDKEAKKNTWPEIMDYINQIIEDTVSDYSSHADQTTEQYLIARYVPEIRIGDAGAIVLAGILKHNTTLKQLELQHSDLTDVGAIALAEAIKHNTTLKFLNLSGNNFHDEGIITLAEAIKHNTTIELVVLEDIVFSEKSSKALANIKNKIVLDEEKKVYQDILEEEEEDPHQNCVGCGCCVPDWL